MQTSQGYSFCILQHFACNQGDELSKSVPSRDIIQYIIQFQIKHKVIVIQWIYLLCCLFVNRRIYCGFPLPKLFIVLQCLSLRIVKSGFVFFSFSAYWNCFKFSLWTTCFVPFIVSSFSVLTLNSI